MKRKPGALLSIEVSILAAAIELLRSGEGEFYGYAVAKEIREQEAARRLTAHGTLYRALGRLEKLGLLASRWEDADIATLNERPRRRLYQITAAGEAAYRELPQADRASAAARERGLAPS
jgi:DNA-binding PadR family transcriptional regulator